MVLLWDIEKVDMEIRHILFQDEGSHSHIPNLLDRAVSPSSSQVP